MNNTQVQELIITQLQTYGFAVLAILTAVIGIGVAYLIFRLGWRATKNVVMGSHGEAFNLHGEALENWVYDDAIKEGGISDEAVSRQFKKYKKNGGTMDREEFEETYFMSVM